MIQKLVDGDLKSVWRDDIATPIAGARLAEILIDPREAYTLPERITQHVALSRDEKRLALCSWLQNLLAEGGEAVDVSQHIQPALAELCALDPAAAGVFRRAFAAHGFAPAC